MLMSYVACYKTGGHSTVLPELGSVPMISSRSSKLGLAQASLRSIFSVIFWSCMCWLLAPTAGSPPAHTGVSSAKLRRCHRYTPAFDMHHHHSHSSDRLPPRLADGSFRFRYVITDYVAANVQAMMSRPAFAQFVSMGILDFAEYGMCMLGERFWCHCE